MGRRKTATHAPDNTQPALGNQNLFSEPNFPGPRFGLLEKIQRGQAPSLPATFLCNLD
jgi:hypothetical protein